jgi:hypothetical protein
LPDSNIVAARPTALSIRKNILLLSAKYSNDKIY